MKARRISLPIGSKGPAQTGGDPPFGIRESRQPGGGGNSLTPHNFIIVFTANLPFALAVLLFPFSGIGVSDAVNLIIVASFIVMGARVVWQRAARNVWRHPGRLESVPV